MSRSRMKVPCMMYTYGCKSRKKGKKQCHKKFRMAQKTREVFKMREVMNTWDMGGDGKRVISWNKQSQEFKLYVRK